MNERLTKLVKLLGEERAVQALEKATSSTKIRSELTIVANAGVHHLPDEILRGRVYVASEGNLNFSSIETVHSEYEHVLRNLATVLKSQKWRRIYLIPFGPTTLSLQIKIVVYRVTALETIDWFYDGRGEYFELTFPQRQIISEAP
jgi:hypothetical protein